jgi:hypothetical protein
MGGKSAWHTVNHSPGLLPSLIVSAVTTQRPFYTFISWNGTALPVKELSKRVVMKLSVRAVQSVRYYAAVQH